MAFWDLDPDLFGVAGTGDVTRRALDLVQAGDIDGLAAVLTASTVAGVKQSCLSLAAYLGALEPLRVLLERGAAEAEGSAELSCLAELLHVVAPQSPADRALLGCAGANRCVGRTAVCHHLLWVLLHAGVGP